MLTCLLREISSEMVSILMRHLFTCLFLKVPECFIILYPILKQNHPKSYLLVEILLYKYIHLCICQTEERRPTGVPLLLANPFDATTLWSMGFATLNLLMFGVGFLLA